MDTDPLETIPEDAGDERRATIVGRIAWQQALRERLAQPGVGWSMYSDDYLDWPLGESDLVRLLREWALPRRRACVRMLARDYARVMREMPRFAQWRNDFGHVIECRQLPTELVAPREGCWQAGQALLALPAQRERRALVVNGASWQASLEEFDQAWDRSEPGFVVHSLGL